MRTVEKFILFLAEQEERKENAQSFIYSLKLQEHFGLTLRESLAIKRSTIEKALKDGYLKLTRKDATPSAKLRKIPIVNKEQREVLEQVLSFMRKKRYHSLIPPCNKLREQYHYAENIRRKFEREHGVKFNYSDLYRAYKEKGIIGNDNIVKLPIHAWRVKYPKDYIWYVDKNLAVRKSFNRPKRVVKDLRNIFGKIMMPGYIKDAFLMVGDETEEIFDFFEQVPITVETVDISKIQYRKGFEYIVFNKAIELTVHSIYWVVDKNGDYHRAPYDFVRFTDYDLPENKKHLETMGFLGYCKEPESGNIGTIISQIGKDTVAGVVKMTKINVEGGGIVNAPHKYGIGDSVDDFSFLSITAYI